jgi:transcription antitermination factor NusG
VGHVKPCQELGLAGELYGADVPFLLPLIRHERRTPSGKFRSSERPLFPSYLFISGDEFDRHNAASTGRLVGTIPVFDVPRLLADLSALMDVIEAGVALAGMPSAPTPGARCRVVGGLFAGKTGTFVRESHRDLLLLHVRILGQVVPTEIESYHVELIDDDD